MHALVTRCTNGPHRVQSWENTATGEVAPTIRRARELWPLLEQPYTSGMRCGD